MLWELGHSCGKKNGKSFRKDGRGCIHLSMDAGSEMYRKDLFAWVQKVPVLEVDGLSLWFELSRVASATQGGLSALGPGPRC